MTLEELRASVAAKRRDLASKMLTLQAQTVPDPATREREELLEQDADLARRIAEVDRLIAETAPAPAPDPGP